MLLSHRAAAAAAASAARSQCPCTASCSGRQHLQPTCRSVLPARSRSHRQPATHQQQQYHQRRQLAPCRPAVAEAGAAADVSTDSSDEDEDEYERESLQVADENNVEPDFFDEHWADKVTDWYEFWHYQDWDQEDLTDAIDDEHDVIAVDDARYASASYERAERMMNELSNIQKYEHAVRVLGPVSKGDSHNAWEMQPVKSIIPDPNPAVSTFDLRAMVEKRKKKELMDAEWKRRQGLVGRTIGVSNVEDVRLHGWIKDDWTDEQINNLITGNGAYAKPEDVLAFIENPLLAADYPNTYGVEYVPDTVEFIESIGHLMHEDDMELVDHEVTFEEQDFVDPGVIFRDEAGQLHMDAPVNQMHQLARMQLADDLETLHDIQEAADMAKDEDWLKGQEEDDEDGQATKSKSKKPAAGKKRGRKKKDETEQQDAVDE